MNLTVLKAAFAEILQGVASTLLFISAAFYYRNLDKTKKQRKLSTFEFTMHIIIATVFALFAIFRFVD
ncbi:hypothetical protein D8M05_18735 [Oceanobacillus bengalensis]|uniref:Uncharacterized protein n=1 Tax=Oceanobacillus bengalensis TaxID=1435466 RepID=A0A494YRT9_9BACI|nr:hypothetical protein D8M05_18735 [Oceanobacillus bengalensis]